MFLKIILIKLAFLFYFGVHGKKDFYFITLPNKLIIDSPHEFQVHTSIDIKLTVKTVHPNSKIAHESPIYVVHKGHGSIPYHVPFIGEHVGKTIILNFRGDIYTNTEGNSSKSISGQFFDDFHTIELINNNFIIFSESDKPIYKPGEMIKLRFLPIYSTNLKSEPEAIGKQWEIIMDSEKKYTSKEVKSRKSSKTFDIIIENPNRLRVAQWKTLLPEYAMNLQYQLSKDPELGKWKCQVEFNKQKEIINFLVKKFVLPNFIVNVFPPTEILAHDNEINFQICAKSSTGKLMNADIEGTFSLVPPYNDFSSRRFKSTLLKKECSTINIYLKSKRIVYNYREYSNSMSVINVTVIEAGTNLRVTKYVEGGSVHYKPYKIHFKSKKYFKPGLPYFGQLLLSHHNNMPKVNETVSISFKDLNQRMKFIFYHTYTSNENGIINFIIPCTHFRKPMVIEVTGTGKIEDPMSNPVLRETLTNFESVDNHYLQIQPLTDSINCPGSTNLKVLTNYDTSTINMHVQIFSRGAISKMITFPPIPFKCNARDDYLGHYKCTNNVMVCLPGWEGVDCRERICNETCLRDKYIAPDTCTCQPGWTGLRCDKCKPSPLCKHGFCVDGNTCQCFRGWRNPTCSEKVPVKKFFYPYFAKTSAVKKSVIKKSVIKKSRKSEKNRKSTIFERSIKVPLLKNMGPDLHIVVYFINPNNEVVADAIEILDGLQNCSQLGGGNFQFNKKSAKPNSKITLTMDSGTKTSSCAVRITDTALFQFGTTSTADFSYLVRSLININHMFTTGFKETHNNKPNCVSHYKSNYQRWPIPNHGLHSGNILSLSGVTAITNARLINSVCNYFTPKFDFYRNYKFNKFRKYHHQSRIVSDNFRPSSISSGSLPLEIKIFGRRNQIDEDMKFFQQRQMKLNIKLMKQKEIKNMKSIIKKQIRKFFPESWIFSYFNKTKNILDLTTPDSLTTWRAESYCMTERGIWMPPTQTLVVNQLFHANIYVPYSIKLDEVLNLPVKLSHYVGTCYEVDAKIIVNVTEIKITGPESFTMCMCSNEEKTVYFNIRPKVIGKLNITVEATSKYSVLCSNEIKSKNDIEMTDAIRRQLFVEPPGIPTETTLSELMCSENEQLGIIELFKLPTKIVSGSLRSYLKFNGDVMGQTFDNLDKLVTMPYGCGEQNMVAVVPSIYVLQYLNGLKLDNPELKHRAKGYITEGYSRQMKYKHDDGSYSAFGKTDKVGSTWLTAFVLRSFSDASKYVHIDRKVLTEAINYLAKMQSETGCFREMGKLFSSTMAGGVKKSDSTDESLLTAYVLISLKDINNLQQLLNIDKALNCVQKGLSKNSNYRLALTAYVFSIYQKKSKLTNSLMEQLRGKVEVSGRYRYWPFNKDGNGNPKINSADVETTGYAFLALHNYQSLPESLKIIYWLSNQRNSLGGYYSTQDTVVALNALAVFAESVGLSKSVYLNVSIILNQFSRFTDLITEENRLVSRIISLGAENITDISIKTNGSGCLSIQLISLYNIHKSYSAADTFKLSVTTKVPSEKECKIRTVNVCFAYLRKDKNSNMILVTINYPSGWQLPTGEMEELTKQIVSPLKRIDFQNTKMELYYDAFSYNDAGKQECFKFKLEEKSKILKLKPAFVRILDYYSPEIYSDAFYDIQQQKCKERNRIAPESPNILLCPSCVEHDRNSTFQFLKTICQSQFTGLVVASENGVQNRQLYQARHSIFYEWTIDLEPTNCSCLNSWSNLDNDFVILSKYWKSLAEKLVLSNDSVMFPLDSLLTAFRFDLYKQCWPANNVYQMMNRINSSFATKNKPNKTCAKCVLESTFNFNIENITSWICGNHTSWRFKIFRVSNTIEGVLSNNFSAPLFVNAEFPHKLCYCHHQMKNLKRSFFILDRNDIIKPINNNKASPLRLLLDNRFEVVEETVFQYNKHIKCGI